MSASAVVPPPNSSSVLRHVPRLTARARALLTTMNLHFAGVAALLVVALYLIVHLIFVMQARSTLNAAAIDQARVQEKAAEIAALPLRGLDTKLVESTRQANEFYATRLPYATSQVAAELGHLAKNGVRMTRAQYAYGSVLTGADALTEMRIDASVSGDYRPVMEYINALERDRMFFVIQSINLTGQQTGQVNLRLRMLTYLRTPMGAETTSDLATASASSATTGGPQ